MQHISRCIETTCVWVATQTGCLMRIILFAWLLTLDTMRVPYQDNVCSHAERIIHAPLHGESFLRVSSRIVVMMHWCILCQVNSPGLHSSIISTHRECLNLIGSAWWCLNSAVGILGAWSDKGHSVLHHSATLKRSYCKKAVDLVATIE